MSRAQRALAAVFVSVIVPAAALAANMSVRVEGTTNLAPLLTQAAAAYSASHAREKVSVRATSSGEGIAALKAHQIDVAMSDVAISDPQLSDTTLGAVGFAFVVGKNAGVSNLTRAQAKRIFAGKLKNWKEIGGKDQPIVIIGREIGTGTRLVLEQQVAKTLVKTRIEPNASAVISAVDATPGAIGYVATGFVGSHTGMVVSYNGVAPTTAAIKNGTYRFATIEHLYALKAASPQVAAFVAYVAHDKTLLAKNGVY